MGQCRSNLISNQFVTPWIAFFCNWQTAHRCSMLIRSGRRKTAVFWRCSSWEPSGTRLEPKEKKKNTTRIQCSSLKSLRATVLHVLDVFLPHINGSLTDLFRPWRQKVASAFFFPNSKHLLNKLINAWTFSVPELILCIYWCATADVVWICR